MDLLMIWICSSVVSVYTVFNQIFKMVKEYADEGYIIDSKDLEEINNSSSSETSEYSNLSLISMFIPIYNLFFALNFVQKYESNKDVIFMYLKALGAVRDMEPFEQEEYKKNPTLSNYAQLSQKYKTYLNNSFKFTINDRNLSTDFYCIMEKGDLVIVKTDGYYSRYSIEEQKKYLCTIMSEFFKKIANNYTSIEEFAKSLNGKKSIVINLEFEEEKEDTKKSDSIKDKYIKLKNEVKSNKKLYDDPYIDCDKSLRLE